MVPDCQSNHIHRLKYNAQALNYDIITFQILHLPEILIQYFILLKFFVSRCKLMYQL